MILLDRLSCCEGVTDYDERGASLSAGTNDIDASATVDRVGATTCARGRSTVEGYAGGLNSPLGFLSFEAAAVGGGCGAEGSICCGVNEIPFSDATMLAIVNEAAAAAARRDIGRWRQQQVQASRHPARGPACGMS